MQADQYIPVTASRKVASVPSDQPKFPWRFTIGSRVYIYRRPPSETAEVIGGELWCNFPHLLVRDITGDVWRVPQLHCSSKTIAFKKD